MAFITIALVGACLIAVMLYLTRSKRQEHIAPTIPSFYVGMELSGTVDTVTGNGVMITFKVHGYVHRGFAPFKGFEDNELLRGDLNDATLSFVLENVRDSECLLPLLRVVRRHLPRRNDYDLLVGC